MKGFLLFPPREPILQLATLRFMGGFLSFLLHSGSLLMSALLLPSLLFPGVYTCRSHIGFVLFQRSRARVAQYGSWATLSCIGRNVMLSLGGLRS